MSPEHTPNSWIISLIQEILSPSDYPIKKQRAEQDREAGRNFLPRGPALQRILHEPLGAGDRSKKSSWPLSPVQPVRVGMNGAPTLLCRATWNKPVEHILS